jgi:sugar (pentulose or hexulose) kinase
MPGVIQQYCRETGQAAPSTKGEILRTVFESLAFKYRYTFERLLALTGRSIDTLHIVGGGARNTLLNQFTANALQVRLLAGPEEATAIGNILVQLAALGEITNLDQARQVVQRSFPPREYLPQDAARWTAAYQVFLQTCRLQ